MAARHDSRHITSPSQDTRTGNSKLIEKNKSGLDSNLSTGTSPRTETCKIQKNLVLPPSPILEIIGEKDVTSYS
jgi:hypothetical protein